ncbi:pantetheine-phosphate adenylyltransferase [Desulfatiglans anilini]|uniref:pantetheine-phosphate adenylyltransferase n=1 Tax=Desulfatiglans anilini TaxID=90728 RepID=UPI0003F4AE84|nr:pantetheine-phosphate adenylyltransferase [Desulfatiglans anilini]
MSEKSAIYPGTFDPVTNGHISIIKRGLKIFDKVIVAILRNSQKTPLFSLEERMTMIRESLKAYPNVEVDSFEGLLVDYAVRKNCRVILRGLRAMSDFEYEFQLALINRKLNRNVQSIFLVTDYKWFYTSSTIIKEAASLGGDISSLIPPLVHQKLKEKFAALKNT